MGNGGYSSIIMIILMLVIFYLFLILPENKKKKKLNEMRSSLKVGDDIVTIGGMMGKVVHVTDDQRGSGSHSGCQVGHFHECPRRGAGCQGGSGSQGCQAESKRSKKGRAEARGAEGPRGVKQLSE